MAPDVYWIQLLEPGHPSRIEKVAGETEIGRDCEGIVVDDPTVSRRHVKLEPTAVGLVVVDLGSANGTSLDGSRIEDPVILHPGSRLKLGETEIVVHQAHETRQSEVPGVPGEIPESSRISEDIRRLKTTQHAPTDPRRGYRQ